MVTLNNFSDGNSVFSSFSLTQMDEKVKKSLYFGTEEGKSLTQYARFPGKI